MFVIKSPCAIEKQNKVGYKNRCSVVGTENFLHTNALIE
jgi:hypothetical protein